MTDDVRPAPGRERRPGASSRAWRAALLLLPALLAFAVQSPSLSHEFAGDDLQVILANPQVTGGASLLDLLRSDWFDSGGTSGIGYYRPVTKASFRLTFALAGPSAFAFHLGSLAAHAAGALFLAIVLARLLDLRVALLGASLWAVHPMTVQAVQNVAARSDVLAGLFFLATLALVGRWVRSPGAVGLAAAGVTSALAIGSKESAALLPAVALVLALVHGAAPRRAAAAGAATGLGVAAVLAVRFAVVNVAPLPNPLAELGVGLRLASVLKAVGAYALSLLTGRPIVRLPQVPESFLDPGVLAGAVVTAALLALLAATRFRSPAALGVVLLGAALAPALAIWHLRISMWKDEVPVAERWLYLPAAGAAILAACLLARLPERAGTLAGAGLAAAFAFGTWQLNPVYASEEAYNDWAAGIYLASPPRNPREEYLARFYRARLLRDARRNEEALAELTAADRLAPWLPGHLWQMAEVQLALGRPGDAVRTLEWFLSPAFRDGPAALAQRIAMGDDSVSRIPAADAWRFLSRARAAAGDEGGARAAHDEALRLARRGAAPVPGTTGR